MHNNQTHFYFMTPGALKQLTLRYYLVIFILDFLTKHILETITKTCYFYSWHLE
jgi:hypothetical protein